MFLAHKDEAFPAFTKKPNISHFRAFGCTCFVHNNDNDDLGKFDARSDEGIFVGYSTSSKAYRVFNKRKLVVEESVHVAFDETDHGPSKYFPRIDSIDDEVPQETSVRNEILVETAPNLVSASADNADGVRSVAAEQENGVSSTAVEQVNELISITPQHRDVDTVPREWRYARNQFKEQIIGDPSQGMMTRSSLRNVCNNLAFLYQVEPKSFVEAEKDESWILAMQEELNQFERNQSKYIKDLLKRFDMEKAKPMGTPMSTSTKLDKDEMGKAFDEKKYRDRKSTSGTCQFLGHSLVSWFSKKQHSVALSTAEAEYVAVGSCCAQVLWMKQQLEDFGLFFDHIPIKCDNTSAINLSKNPIQHSRTKHIDIRHHFIRDHVQRGDVVIDFVRTDNQLADIFTKPLSEDRFCSIRRELGMSNPC
ncbi:hypothetical protein RHSIM_Rhsim02G0176400 [Rhododendron simsii]|uniref:Retroviral polymerase SH3-like domain-containing protein n=1 Tax=Rhododendron simsii TaxID=118357 RepID=A0A834HN94_RHOSS|nr:hypothetical protein RHSIM_Rhsim02G0176400 [Rhododendron simsii]